jgi:hypothetical protein
MINLRMPPTQRTDNREEIISHVILRLLIGMAGILMPLLLVAGKLIYNSDLTLEDSISDYYDDGAAGDIFVGILFVLGAFLFSYRGKEPIDSKAANVGSLAAIGVALFPTMSSLKWVSFMHFVFAILLFSVFIFFALVIFRKHKPSGVTDQKKIRNQVYLVSGIIMIICVVAIGVCFLALDEAVRNQYNLVFWFESIALMTFGFSWITKAEVIFGDIIAS